MIEIIFILIEWVDSAEWRVDYILPISISISSPLRGRSQSHIIENFAMAAMMIYIIPTLSFTPLGVSISDESQGRVINAETVFVN